MAPRSVTFFSLMPPADGRHTLPVFPAPPRQVLGGLRLTDDIYARRYQYDIWKCIEGHIGGEADDYHYQCYPRHGEA